MTPVLSSCSPPSWFEWPTAGSWPDWFAAIGTVGALVLVIRVYTKDKSRQLQEKADQEIRQARVISSTIISAEEGSRDVEAAVINGSDQPIHDIEFHLLHDGQDAAPVEAPDRSVIMTILPTGESLSLLAAGRSLRVYFRLYDPLPGGPYLVTAVDFTDGAGMRWRKVGHGEPRKIHASGA